MLLCLSNLGSFMASSFQFAFGKIYCCLWCSSQRCCQRRRRRTRTIGQLPVPPLIHQESVPVVVVQQVEDDRPQQPMSKANHRRDDASLLLLGELAALKERDYDIVQPEEQMILLDQQQQHSANRQPDRFYGMERLDQDARLVLADCSHYCDDQTIVNGMCVLSCNGRQCYLNWLGFYLNCFWAGNR